MVNQGDVTPLRSDDISRSQTVDSTERCHR
jgi:hypothetical protein